MVNAHRKAIEALYKDTCTVYEYTPEPAGSLSDCEETAHRIIENVPCRLSFETINAAGGDEVATVTQSVKLFCAPELEIPPGCKIVVTQKAGRVFEFSQSGLPAIHCGHQEIMLVPFRGYA